MTGQHDLLSDVKPRAGKTPFAAPKVKTWSPALWARLKVPHPIPVMRGRQQAKLSLQSSKLG
jgi:hypothetical protein